MAMGEKTLVRQLPHAATLDEIRALLTTPATPASYQRVERRPVRRLPRATPLVVKREPAA